MLSLRTLIVIMLAGFLQLSLAAETWTYLGKGDSGTEYFWDRESVVVDHNGTAIVWVKEVWSDEDRRREQEKWLDGASGRRDFLAEAEYCKMTSYFLKQYGLRSDRSWDIGPSIRYSDSIPGPLKRYSEWTRSPWPLTPNGAELDLIWRELSKIKIWK